MASRTEPQPDGTPERWALLIHQIPPRPAYLRVKIGRHLQRLGAVAIKNSVYALPHGDEAVEDLQWVLREVMKGGGEGAVVEARLVDGLSGPQLVALFDAAREVDYRALIAEARTATRALPRRGLPPENRRSEAAGQVVRLRRRLAEIVAIDFFGATGREVAEGLVAALEERMKPTADVNLTRVQETQRVEEVRGRCWVTRAGIKVDRLASAWLIRRFIDPEARFRFVAASGYAPEPGELRFDMFEAEYTHEGEACTFEVLVRRFDLQDPALQAVAEIVHDLDVKDGRYGRDEAAGVGQLVAGIVAACPDDLDRLARGAALFDDLYAGSSAAPRPRPAPRHDDGR
jgi:hypothetical protein